MRREKKLPIRATESRKRRVDKQPKRGAKSMKARRFVTGTMSSDISGRIQNAICRNLSSQAMDRLDNLGPWHLAVSVSLDAFVRIRNASDAERCTARCADHFCRSN